MGKQSSRFSKHTLLALACLAGWLQPIGAASGMPDCEWLANRMESQLALPAGLLASIAEVEAGRKRADGSLKAWPWTINHAGKGLFFETEKDALAYAQKHIETGDLNMDLGCMQVSVKWHLDRFSDPAQMLDPVSNVAYAASFLEQLYQRHGSWDEAVRHYHNADRRQSNPYLQKVRAVWKQEPEPSQPVAVASASQPDPPPRMDRVRELVSRAVAAPPPRPAAPSAVREAAAAARPIDKQANGKTHIKVSNQTGNQTGNQMQKKHPSLAGQWDKIARFRKILAEEKAPSS